MLREGHVFLEGRDEIGEELIPGDWISGGLDRRQGDDLPLTIGKVHLVGLLATQRGGDNPRRILHLEPLQALDQLRAEQFSGNRAEESREIRTESVQPFCEFER